MTKQKIAEDSRELMEPAMTDSEVLTGTILIDRPGMMRSRINQSDVSLEGQL